MRRHVDLVLESSGWESPCDFTVCGMRRLNEDVIWICDCVAEDAPPASLAHLPTLLTATPSQDLHPHVHPHHQIHGTSLKDITLASDLHHHSTTISPTTLQDFLATPFHKHHPPKKDASSSAAADTTFLPSLTPQPAGLLSFNSGSGVVDLGFLESTNASTVQVRAADPQSRTVVNATPSNFVATYNSALLDTLGSSSVFPSRTNNTKKRPKENGDASTDRRHKRLIKNRESAARSRARKQESWLSIYPLVDFSVVYSLMPDGFWAYTNELELEVAHLQEENARLRRQQTKVYLAAAAQLPKQHTLYRTLTAPF
ncbi:hypothetical protein FNV43_RR11992 [Rhamnella rubrinervis]|uniref:BZIP domain-containing protein n=1 Tax=Rhamnella rubrinervis TaxID=2594499 RepID=A0A8K0MI87_9ROSA|nr:hypothetical protein FNV43_RR11992 [Rhamnella rubrinervis]